MKSLFDGTSWEIRYIETGRELYEIKNVKGKNGEYLEVVFLNENEKENLLKQFSKN